jgi:pimeloyl-ACP methyl ester carboxylesterase
MATFVLVHGAWHGGWCYTRVARLLRSAGHEVYTPTHTGVGERSHLADQNITLSTHIRDVVNVIEYENLSDIILCGHSYGGMVITGVAAQVGDRIRTLVYLDAFLPEDGQSLFDLIAQSEPERIPQFLSLAAANGGKLPPIPAAAFNVNPNDAEWVDKTCCPQSLATFVEGVRLTGKEKAVRNRTYILATGYGMQVFPPFYERVKKDSKWRAHTVPCGHDVMLDQPEALAKLLLEEVTRQ